MWILVDTRDSVLGGDRGDMDIICRYGRYYRAREWIGYEPGMLSETLWRLNHSKLLYLRQVTSVMIFNSIYHDIKCIIMWFCERKVCENSFKKCHCCRFCCRRKPKWRHFTSPKLWLKLRFDLYHKKAWYPYSVLSFCAEFGNCKIRKKRVVVQESIINHKMERLLIP